MGRIFLFEHGCLKQMEEYDLSAFASDQTKSDLRTALNLC
jgi:hypothetical protein